MRVQSDLPTGVSLAEWVPPLSYLYLRFMKIFQLYSGSGPNTGVDYICMQGQYRHNHGEGTDSMC
jgi:hypothetical protein